jgi:hypothetical protein
MFVYLNKLDVAKGRAPVATRERQCWERQQHPHKEGTDPFSSRLACSSSLRSSESLPRRKSTTRTRAVSELSGVDRRLLSEDGHRKRAVRRAKLARGARKHAAGSGRSCVSLVRVAPRQGAESAVI